MKCLKCGNEIMDRGRLVACEKNDRNTPSVEKCNFQLWRDNLETLGLAELSDDQMIELCLGNKIPLSLISKAKKPFTCLGIMREVNGRWKIEFEFEEKVKPPAKVFRKIASPQAAPNDLPDEISGDSDWED